MGANPLQTAELEATLQQAVRHHQAGQLAEAERLYRSVLQFRPDHPGISNHLAIALKDQGKVEEAAALFRRAVAMAPGSAPAHGNLGNILFEQGKLAEAEASYRRALALQPDMADALKNLGLVIVDSGRFAESFPWFRRHAALVYGKPGGSSGGEPPPPFKVQHDEEQRAYLGSGAAAFNLEAGARVSGRAVNPDQSNGEIGAKWQNGTPQIAVIDNLLSDEALERLRQFCWRSTIWHKIYRRGYLGAMAEHGFACPVLAQVVDEMRATYPEILGKHPLLRWWGFKYNSQLSGINIHADFAAVNVNIWITPDEANLDPEGGGLEIWDTPAPLDWSFNQYNAPNSGEAMQEFLKKSGAKSVNVPYRANRAVIFDSDLFHKGTNIDFKEGYLNRRINITMLFGRREATARPA